MCNHEPTTIHYSGSVPVETEGCEDVHFERYAVAEFLSAEKKFLPSTFIVICRQCMRMNVLI
jgi:hypothetical protein